MSSGPYSDELIREPHTLSYEWSASTGGVEHHIEASAVLNEHFQGGKPVIPAQRQESQGLIQPEGRIPPPCSCSSRLVFAVGSDHWQAIKEDPTTPRTHTDISRIAAARWRALPEDSEERKYYKHRAALESEAHRQKYPGYKCQPGSRKDKRAKRNTSRKTNHRRFERILRAAAGNLLGSTFGNS
ncbi:hypothetical protein SCP_1002880 [Sparassis crispa]|uniref:HMG box domain-containing protein n=1 Tax=Sparassis crispa TaxID=139825 RepID=A0A401GXW6_9APHY|nr:hypothetical protein SCP_1002880 [Sparassis crispa]GBE87041.1 hypothetical protein SCP_1002880 [Sparassis crispa]